MKEKKKALEKAASLFVSFISQKQMFCFIVNVHK